MKKKTANALICRKIDDWISTIDDPNIRKLAEENTIVTGGCIASMLLGEDVNDFDIYFKSQEVAKEIATYYMGKFNALPEKTFPIDHVNWGEGGSGVSFYIRSAGVAKKGKANDYEYFETVADPNEQATRVEDYLDQITELDDVADKSKELGKYHPIFVSENAMTLSNDIQLVFRFTGTPDEIHSTYDYVHCTNYWTSWDRKITTNQQALESLLAKELVYMNSNYPICAMIRLRKFIRRGWTINAGQMFKIAYVISNLDLDDPAVLKDQLTGVDVAYFNQLLTILNEKRKKDEDFTLTFGYLSELIDRIF